MLILLAVAAERHPAVQIGARDTAEPRVAGEQPHMRKCQGECQLDRGECEDAAREDGEAASDDPLHRAFRTTKFSSRSRSMPLRAKVSSASVGVLTMGSPLRLKDVLSTSGTPVASANFSMRRW